MSLGNWYNKKYKGFTPLQMATAKHHQEIIDYLKSQGAK